MDHRGGVLLLSLNCQNIGSARPFLVTLNPTRVPDHVLHKWNTSHPNPSVAATKASLELNYIQGKRGLWFCGSYQGTLVTVHPSLSFYCISFSYSKMSLLCWTTGYGFHEDSVKVLPAQPVLL
jgi:cyclopropane-fatty-acyl-phospholipid synthase